MKKIILDSYISGEDTRIWYGDPDQSQATWIKLECIEQMEINISPMSPIECSFKVTGGAV